MPDILIRDLDPETVAYWKSRASGNGRSMQSEIKSVLREHRKRELGRAGFHAAMQRARHETAGTSQTDSALLLAEDRRR